MEDTTPTTSNYIPIDLITSEVLPRLPVKTLVRFSAVCKSWYSLIRNPDFVNSNLLLNLSKPMIPCFLCTCYCQRFAAVNPCDCHLYSYSSWFIASENPHGQPAVHMLGYDFSSMFTIGTCKGLISLHLDDEYDRGTGIILYNPYLRILKAVEKFRPEDYPYYFYGFGYNEETNDHRLVRVTYKNTNAELYSPIKDFDYKRQHVEVYSLIKDSWHAILQVPPRLLVHSGKSGLYLNGATHWLTYRERNDNLRYSEYPDVMASIISFDFNQEIFRDVMLPRELQVDDHCFIDISEFEGSLALFVADEHEGQTNYKSNTFYIWVMRENGVVQSWNKRFKLCFPEHSPRGLLRDGRVVLEKNYKGKLEELTRVFYGLENRQFKDFGRFNCLKRVDDFAESLWFLGSDNVFYNYPDGCFDWLDFW